MHNYLKTEDQATWFVEEEGDSYKVAYRVKEVLFEKQSLFQHVMILDTDIFGKMLVLDGRVQTTQLDGHYYHEMAVHTSMSIHLDVKRVLIIGGGDCWLLKELVKYETIEQIDQVEIDAVVVEACQTYLDGAVDDARIQYIYEDGSKYIKEVRDAYDLIIIDSTDPRGIASPLFDEPFYQNVNQALKKDGLMLCQSQSPIFHVELIEQLFATNKKLYPHVRLITHPDPSMPGGTWSLLLCSKRYNQIYVTDFNKDTRFVNHSMLDRCFVLPKYLEHLG